MCNETVHTYPCAIQIVRDWHKKCDKAVDTCHFLFDSVPGWCKTQEICDKALDVCLPVLKIVHDWFVSNKMLEKLDTVVFFKDNIVFVNVDSDHAKFFSDSKNIVVIAFHIVSLDDVNSDDDDPEMIILVRFIALSNRHKQCKSCKEEISKKLMSVAWHPTRWWYSWLLHQSGTESNTKQISTALSHVSWVFYPLREYFSTKDSLETTLSHISWDLHQSGTESNTKRQVSTALSHFLCHSRTICIAQG